MNVETPTIHEPLVTLPESAPLVRITAGVGSAGQKTWNLRRPVTLIGSSRPAHIILHDKDIAKAHCVIVNTGTDVLLKDLRTSGGTSCNRNPVDLVVLADGDLITVGENNIQVAINLPDDESNDSGCGLEFVDPIKFPKPIDIHLIHAEQQWKLEDAVVLIGRLAEASIRLDHEDVSLRHAVIFRFADKPAVFDLGARNGVWVNGKRCSVTMLKDGDSLTVGPFGLSFGSPEIALLNCAKRATENDPILEAVSPKLGTGTSAASRSNPNGPVDSSSDSTAPQTAPADRAEPVGGESVQPPDAHPQSPAGDLQLWTAIGDTWDRLNTQTTEPAVDNGEGKSPEEQRLSAWAAELEARDAALRGELHDVTCLHEQVQAREREADRVLSEAKAAQDAIKSSEAALAQRDAELSQRTAEVQRRENALAQRWTRMRSATCPHCGKPVNVNQVGAGGR